MNTGPNQPQQHAGGGGGRRRRRRRGGAKTQAQGPAQHQGGQPKSAQQHPGNHNNRRQNRQQNRPRKNPGFVGPMDHSYRAQEPNGNVANGPFRGGFPGGQSGLDVLEPLPPLPENAPPRIFAFIEDLFFLAKINEISRKLNLKVQFVKTEKEILERFAEQPEEKPTLIIFDLNNNTVKPLVTIPKLRKEYKKGTGTSIIGFLSHIQGDLKLKAQEAGCDSVMPRSAFSANLPQLLRRHAAADEEIVD